ncbi:phosphopantetheine binding protein [Flavobacterium sp. 90]|uniref:beta-ketoacyl synthase N-terminal-like domain-containing protein n=1 Tax=unclassified Flavobacterium TaxID=196869 RepID=UPI000EB36963|nr:MULTISPECIES: beta-ketoacyl synthase N-terminal-like domain-containing protein [unclassified Flavobacterium]RKR12110.1 phosphopantetheine binding protein [Flavobacterium sp. 81]TCK55877.1 phosphopantetheine binding protein [Flavobacterium sp. 90]
MQESVAIIGVSFEFPGIKTWKNLTASLTDSKTYIDHLSSDRLEDIYNRFGNVEMSQGGYLPNIDQFDNKYFGTTEREATKIFPEHRLFLLHAVRAFYDAGYVEEDLKGSNTGIFYTASKSAYANFSELSFNEFDALFGIEGTRLANFLDLRGPVIAIDTTCSSSLVAVNNAIHSLNFKECDKALVGGVKFSAITKAAADESTVVSKKQHCKPFDEDADGLMNGEGAVCIVLKRLKDAERDKDPIYGIIKGSGINHGGARISSLTAPSSDAQKDVIVKAWGNAEVSSNQIKFIEAHGTGTILGDPIEFEGLKAAFLEDNQSNALCSISSFKGQIGHLDYLSGLAGLIRLIAALNNKVLPIQANFKRLNKHLNTENSPVKIQDSNAIWESTNGERIGGVSSFGLTGTNVHLVVSQKEEIKQLNTKEFFYLQISEDTKERFDNLKKQILKKVENLNLEQLSQFCHKTNRLFQLKNENQGYVFSSLDMLRNDLKAAEKSIPKNAVFYILDLDILEYNKDIITSILEENELISLQWDKNIPHSVDSIDNKKVLNVLFQFVLYKYLIANLNKKVKFITKKGEGIIEQLVNKVITPLQLINNPELCVANDIFFDEEAFKKYLEINNASDKVILVDFSNKNPGRFNDLKLDLVNINGTLTDLQRFKLYSEIIIAGANALKSKINPMFHDSELPYFDLKRFWPETKQIVQEKAISTIIPDVTKYELLQITEIVKEVWCEILEITEIEVDDNFFDLGGTSLTALDMMSEVESKINGSTISYEEMYNHTTITELSQFIFNQLKTKDLIETEKKEVVNVTDDEIRKNDYELLIQNIESEQYNKIIAKKIVVTGATGLVGSFLVEYLLKNTDAQIVCLVRGDDYNSEHDKFWTIFNQNFKIQHSSRIQIVKGDLSLINFGSEQNDVLANVDTVFHVAGSPSFVSQYKPKEHINYIGTKNCIDWANSNGVQNFNLISTIGIVGQTMPKEIKNFYETDLNVGQEAGNLIHASSKLLAEEYLKDHFKNNAKVFRIPNVGGRYEDGFIPSDLSKNLMSLKLKYFHEVGYYSDEIMNWYAGIIFTPVDHLAGLIVEIALTDINSLKTYHLNIEKGFSFGEIVSSFLKNDFDLKKIEHHELLQKLEQMKKNSMNVGLNLYKVGQSEAEEKHNFSFQNEATMKIIKKLNISFVNSYNRFHYLGNIVKFYLNGHFKNENKNQISEVKTL